MRKYKAVVTTEYIVEAASKSIAQHLFFNEDSPIGKDNHTTGAWATQIAQSVHFTRIKGDTDVLS